MMLSHPFRARARVCVCVLLGWLVGWLTDVRVLFETPSHPFIWQVKRASIRAPSVRETGLQRRYTVASHTCLRSTALRTSLSFLIFNAHAEDS
jgi:hypothetical protein